MACGMLRITHKKIIDESNKKIIKKGVKSKLLAGLSQEMGKPQ
jgi:hypothetical protein